MNQIVYSKEEDPKKRKEWQTRYAAKKINKPDNPLLVTLETKQNKPQLDDTTNHNVGKAHPVSER